MKQQLTRTETISYLNRVVVGLEQPSLTKIKKRADVTSYYDGQFYVYCNGLVNLEPGETLEQYFERRYPYYEMDINIQNFDY